jgi:hypothetical protein
MFSFLKKNMSYKFSDYIYIEMYNKLLMMYYIVPDTASYIRG